MISRKEAEAYARKSHTLFLECSAKTRYGVKEAFEELVRKVRFFFALYYKDNLYLLKILFRFLKHQVYGRKSLHLAIL